MSDRVFAVAGDWAVASDGIQWMLMKQQKGKTPWKGVSFVRSTKDVLARCMREKGVDEHTAIQLLVGLPDTFDQWLAANSDPLKAAFVSQRAQAKQRGIGWELKYWEWLQIWQDSGHLHERGVRKGEWVMSRPGDQGPYAAGNVRIVRCETNNSEAAKKRWPHHRCITTEILTVR